MQDRGLRGIDNRIDPLLGFHVGPSHLVVRVRPLGAKEADRVGDLPQAEHSAVQQGLFERHIVGGKRGIGWDRNEDFVVDDLRSRVLVLSSRRDGTIRLTAYSMPEGRQQQEAVLPFVHGYTMGLALASETGQVGVSVDSAGRSSSKGDIYVCGSVASFDCANLAPQIDSVYQISFLGRQLLAASNHPTFNKKDCILASDLDTHSVSRKYCSPATGVHYAVGVVNMKYVVAYTGLSKDISNFLIEGSRPVSSSFSVWRVDTPQVTPIAKAPTDIDSQSFWRVAASSVGPLFIAYPPGSNVLYLYSIVDQN